VYTDDMEVIIYKLIRNIFQFIRHSAQNLTIFIHRISNIVFQVDRGVYSAEQGVQ
jgi:hypothetical protein